MAEYDLEQRSGELLQAVVCRGCNVTAEVRPRSAASNVRHCILLVIGEKVSSVNQDGSKNDSAIKSKRLTSA